MARSEPVRIDSPQRVDLDRCVHCGLCLNACPTYRELGVEMDSPRGRVYQMVKVAEGALPLGESYIRHIDLCLACRACESACPSGVEYGKLVEAARAHIEQELPRPWHQRLVRGFLFGHLLSSPTLLRLAAAGLWIYQRAGLQRLVRSSGVLKLFGRLEEIEKLAPEPEFPTFFRHYGKVFPAAGERKYKVAFLGGCIANVSFARLHEATVRVLQNNGCEVHVPRGQTCCGALHVHSGMRDTARALARRNIDVLLGGGYDAIITNAAGCGSTLKEYHHLFAHEEAYRQKSRQFIALVRDVNEFLASLELNTRMGEVRKVVTYQDSCHLLHGQKIKVPPRKLLRAVPGLELRELPLSEICCGSAGVYNVVQNEMAMKLLANKMENVSRTGCDVIATANPGCMLQLRAGARMNGGGLSVRHVIEILDEAYRNYRE